MLEGWKGKLFSRGGRLQLVNSVLSFIPIYFMACFQLPQWLIQRLDRIRRSFLWGQNEDKRVGISLINWDTVCLPKEWGGLGVSNLRLRNISLLLRWWWRLYTNPNCLWTEKVVALKKKPDAQDGTRRWIYSGSFFWGSLHSISHLFNMSTKLEGQSASVGMGIKWRLFSKVGLHNVGRGW